MDRLPLEVAYQEILKTEVCVIRHGHYCVDYDNETYVSIFSVTIHDFDERLSFMDLLYSLVKASERYGKDLKSFVNEVLASMGRTGSLEDLIRTLVEEGLLFEDDCSNMSHVMRVSAVNKVRSLSREFNVLVRYNYAWEEISRNREARDFLKLEDKFRGKCFMTYHGYFMRVMRNLGPYPGEGRVMEAYILPFIEEGVAEYDVPLNTLAPVMIKFVEGISGSPSSPSVVKALMDASPSFIRGGMLSRFQAELLKRFLSSNEPMIGVISAPTSAGKTTIFFLYVILKILAFKAKKDKRKVMLVYPRKTLAREQLQRMVNFLMDLNSRIQDLGLSPITLAIYDGDSPSTAKALSSMEPSTFRGLKCPDGKLMLYRDGKPICGDRPVNWLTEVKDQGYQSDILVTNLSQMATNLFQSFNEKVNLFDDLSALVVDEAHTFADPEQSSHFFYTILEILTYLAEREKGLPLEKPMDDMKEVVRKLNLDLIFSSATLWGVEKDKNLDLRGVGGFKGIGRAGAGQGLPHPVEDFLDTILLNLKDLYSRKEFLDFYSITSVGEKRQRKLIVPMIIFPAPEYSGTLPFTLALLYTMFFSDSAFRRMKVAFPRGLNAIMFVDSKSQQNQIAESFLETVLKINRYHEDISLISPLRYGTKEQTDGSSLIRNELIRAGSILDRTFTTYSVLNLYYTREQLSRMSSPETWLEAVRSRRLPALRDGKTLLDVLDDIQKGLNSTEELQLMGENSLFYLVYHNADLKRDERIKREEVLSFGSWRLALATSTLELGVDLPNVGIILQQGIPLFSDSVIQRFGRGGRNDDVLRVSLGVLAAKPYGQDVSLFDEDYAIRRLFFPVTFRPKASKTRREIVKAHSYVALIGFLSRTLGKDVEETVDYISTHDDFRDRARDFLLSMLSFVVKDPAGLVDEVIEDMKQIARIYTYSRRQVDIPSAEGNLVMVDVERMKEIITRITGEVEDMCKGRFDDLCRNGLVPLQRSLEVAMEGERVNLASLVTSSSKIINAFYLVNDKKDGKNRELLNLRNDLRDLAGFFYPHSYFSKRNKRNFLHFLTYWVKPEVPHPSIRSMESISFTISKETIEERSQNRSDVLLKDVPMRRSK
ncbi:ATP-dependent RNA helicase SrmB [Metallosphaera sp. J1]|uniref:DEAD/DEAH box helicase n=1 Tax=Metallosphaera javensis (ex Hofmann et al. 2022) TaxID=99938 RepID=UPI001EE14ACE|nr:DEAD/DEAH box helicase [Metallosphaera javensis (ex Hofmann et al. 2022)]MCG3109217.1 ATP-dependent RNA helicase SrmB [Metallosphaera javensis (ex Hofmann et al. 2022)]